MIQQIFKYILVHLPIADKGLVNIEDIKVGDYVYTVDIEGNLERELEKVEAVINSTSKEFYIINIGNNEKIEVTAMHPFYVVDKGWVRAKDLLENDKLLGKDNSIIAIQDIEYVEYNEEIPVFNLTIQNMHYFLVSQYEILVHNHVGKTHGGGSN